MKRFNPLNHIKTGVAVIDKNMTVVDANESYKSRNENANVVGNCCYQAAYSFSKPCNKFHGKACPVEQSFKTRKAASTVHHFWIDDHAVVEEVTTTPILDEQGNVEFVVEEFRDVTELLGLHKGLIGICSYCRKVRNNDGKWVSFETYIHQHTGANFTHSICNNCNTYLQEKIKK
jgi:hypothetical protein